MAREKVSFRSGPQVDMTLLLVVVLITSIGLVNLYSATSAYVGASRHAALADVYVTQIYWIVIGFLVAMLLAAIDYRHLERIAPVLYIGGLLSLALLFVVGGEGIRGANRWLKLGSFSFQPSDTMKPLVALMIRAISAAMSVIILLPSGFCITHSLNFKYRIWTTGICTMVI